MDVIRCNVAYKIAAYNIIRMEEEEEEEETFWYHCARLVKAITLYHNYNYDRLYGEKISDVCIFLHKHCMVNGGEYSNNGRIVGSHLAVDPLYIEEYMETLNKFYEKHKYEKNIDVLIYYNFITIHPFSDGNGRVGKALIFILRGKFKGRISQFKGVPTKKDHKKLCKELGRLQKKTYNMFNINLDVNILNEILT